MSKLILITSLSFFLFILAAEAHSFTIFTEPPLQEQKGVTIATKENLLNTVKVTVDKNNNRIYFSSPHVLTNVNVTIKQQGDRVIVQETNITINKNYSITFPTDAGINKYTVILQKDNQIVVKRIDKNWM